MTEEKFKKVNEDNDLMISDEQLCDLIISRFKPLTEEEQTTLLKAMLISYFHYMNIMKDEYDGLYIEENRFDKKFSAGFAVGSFQEVQYLIDFMTEAPKELKEIGCDMRKFMTKTIKEEFDKMFGSDNKA